MGRHRTALTPRERVRAGLRWVGRLAAWLALGALVGFAAWGALTWAGSRPEVARWAGVGAGALTAVAAAVSSTLPGAAQSPDEPTDGPSSS